MPANRAFQWSDRGPEYLILDTETTGKPRNYNAPISDWDNWPRVVQIAWLVYDEQGTLLDRQAFLIRPEGFTIPLDVVRVHHITTEIALQKGVPLRLALDRFCHDLEQTACVVAHNIEFDLPIIAAELDRMGTGDPFAAKGKFCTMKDATEYCRLPGTYGRYKWPRLEELYAILFRERCPEQHDAAADAEMTARCFWELKRRKVF